jgi:hypothetical protein
VTPSPLPAGLSDTDAIRHAYINEWKVLAMLPVHRNVNRFLGEFVSTVPDPMFDALTPDLKELGACLRRACTHRCACVDVYVLCVCVCVSACVLRVCVRVSGAGACVFAPANLLANRHTPPPRTHIPRMPFPTPPHLVRYPQAYL